MIAIYERDKKLNVREAPEPGAKVVRQMAKGDSEECFGTNDGWARLRDGFAMARYLTIRDGSSAPDTVEDGGRADEPPAEAVSPEPEAVDDPERAVLREKTVKELRDIAEQSGIAVAKGAKKDEIIDALLSDD